MAYATLSTEIKKLTNPQRSDAFVKAFRNAVREGKFDAADLPSRFTLPKEFGRRGSDETYQRDAKDMVFETSPAYDAWFAETNKELASSRRGGTIKPTLENIEAGLIDFKELAATTRQKMQSSFSKGQALGNSRKKDAPAKKTTTRKRK